MTKSVHILILGSSEGHIFSIIDHFHPDMIILVSSENFRKETKILAKKIRDLGIIVDIFFINPFSAQIFDIFSNFVSKKLRELKEDCESLEVYMGLTGGTNLMAVASGFIAREFKLKAHYVVKDSNEVIEFDFAKSNS